MEQHLLPYAAELFGEGEQFLLIIDNAPWHNNQVCRECKENRPFVIIPKFPPNGSELNLMETVWAEMTNTWQKNHERTQAPLDAHVRIQWEALRQRPQFFSRLVEGYSARLEEVVAIDGHAIRW